ncbi:MAG: fimbria/pilus outer membrane usher protein [Rhizobium sp.]
MKGRTRLPLALIGLILFLVPMESLAQSGIVLPDRDTATAMLPAPAGAGRDLYLMVLVNGVSTNLIAAFHQDPDGVLTIDAEQLRNVGIAPVKKAAVTGGRIRIDRLPSVTYVYDEPAQTIAFTATDRERAPKIIDATLPSGGASQKKPRLQAQSSYGTVLNYSVVAATDNSQLDGRFGFSGLSGSFEARMFSPVGVFDNTFIASTSDDSYYGSTRLESTWRYSDQASMMTYSVGDIITGGLSWTRPTRLGGIQLQRSFALRSDLVTFPVPELSGSAAVPSTVDVYLNDAKRFSSNVAAGPFDITNLPIVDGAGNARVVLTDAQGQQVTTNSSFIASSQLLAPGLHDFSAELGFARQNYGTDSNDYDDRPYGSATLRSGMTNWLTMEGHAEGGADLFNGGVGVVFASRLLGVISLSAAGSYNDAAPGHQLGFSLEKEMWGVHLGARVQRSAGNYQDIASVTASDRNVDDAGLFYLSSEPPKALDQLSLSLPLIFDNSNLNFSLTHVETADGEKQRLLGVSYTRPVFNGSTLSLSAIKDLEHNNLGVYASLTVPFGADRTTTTSVSSQAGDLAIGETVSKSQGQRIGDYGWSVGRQQEDNSVNSASASYRSSVAEIGARVDQRGSIARANVTVDGAFVAAGGGVFASNRIDDAFAIVDAGAPNVAVQYENRPAGTTNGNGKLLVPQLRAYQGNNISIDPTNLPLDAVVNNTRNLVMPADRSGIVVKFDVDVNASAALVAFSGPDGKPVEMGASGQATPDAAPFVIGYDGQALVENLVAVNHVTITLRDGSTCNSTFKYNPQPGKQVNIPDAICKR